VSAHDIAQVQLGDFTLYLLICIVHSCEWQVKLLSGMSMKSWSSVPICSIFQLVGSTHKCNFDGRKRQTAVGQASEDLPVKRAVMSYMLLTKGHVAKFMHCLKSVIAKR
jgi:hypothetical protein